MQERDQDRANSPFPLGLQITKRRGFFVAENHEHQITASAELSITWLIVPSVISISGIVDFGQHAANLRTFRFSLSGQMNLQNTP